MATFEAGTAVPPNATDPASSTFLWPMFFGHSASPVVSSTQTKQISDTSEYTRKKMK